jgi:hypothetical protein
MVGGRKQWKQAMPTASDVRTIALALDGVSAVDHWDRPGYRTKKRIFAVMRPDGLYLNLPEERKQFLFQAAPEVFVRFMWGKTENLIVQIAKLSRKELEGLLREAWQNATPSAKPAKPRTPATRSARGGTRTKAMIKPRSGRRQP